MLDKTHNYLSIMLALLTTSAMLMFSGPLRAAAADHPRIDAGVPFFYYSDLNQAADWYENKLGLKKIADEDWVVIFALNPYSQIGLVDATGGSLRPIEDKGALLSQRRLAVDRDRGSRGLVGATQGCGRHQHDPRHRGRRPGHD
jgi:catechol 2,3-dioxygenase-like lactoylglutathione lyase family enzyme